MIVNDIKLLMRYYWNSGSVQSDYTITYLLNRIVCYVVCTAVMHIFAIVFFLYIK